VIIRQEDERTVEFTLPTLDTNGSRYTDVTPAGIGLLYMFKTCLAFRPMPVRFLHAKAQEDNCANVYGWEEDHG